MSTERTLRAVRTRRVAIADPPESIEANPIHGAEGAVAAGYAGALVAGIHTYGWASEAILEALGDGWLSDGWADVAYRRPVHPGDELVTTVVVGSGSASGAADDQGDVPATVSVRTTKADGTLVLDGEAGLGRASWFDELERPEAREPQPPIPPGELVRMELESAPVGRDYRPMAVDASLAFARAWASTRLEDDDPRWHEGERPLLHPSFLAGRMTPLFRHNYRYGPGIHVRTRILHLAPAGGGLELVVTARLHAAYERKGHHYHESDCWILGEDGEALAAKRHVGVFRVGAR
jgi:acyl dehydratase